MKDTAPKGLGVITVAALFGIVAFLVSLVVLDFSGIISFLIGALVAVITAIVLWLGWREPAPGPTGPRDLSSEAARKAGAGAQAAPTVDAGAAGATAAAAAARATTSAAPARAAAGDTGAAATDTGNANGAAGKSAAKSNGSASAAQSTDAAQGDGDKAAKAAASKAAKPKAAKPAAKAKDAKPAAEKSAGAKSPAKSSAAKSTATKSTAAKSATPEAAPVAADGKPETLSGPRAGGADDLKLLKGVGPKLENTLNELGFYHFSQVAAWRKEEVEWVDSRLKFKGRIERDGWIEQAKILAEGGETEFSKRSKKK